MDCGSGIAVSCGVGRRRGLDLVWLWLWLAAVPLDPWPGNLHNARGAALKSKKKKAVLINPQGEGTG